MQNIRKLHKKQDSEKSDFEESGDSNCCYEEWLSKLFILC